MMVLGRRCSATEKVTEGLAENDILSSGLWLTSVSAPTLKFVYTIVSYISTMWCGVGLQYVTVSTDSKCICFTSSNWPFSLYKIQIQVNN